MCFFKYIAYKKCEYPQAHYAIQRLHCREAETSGSWCHLQGHRELGTRTQVDEVSLVCPVCTSSICEQPLLEIYFKLSSAPKLPAPSYNPDNKIHSGPSSLDPRLPTPQEDQPTTLSVPPPHNRRSEPERTATRPRAKSDAFSPADRNSFQYNTGLSTPPHSNAPSRWHSQSPGDPRRKPCGVDGRGTERYPSSASDAAFVDQDRRGRSLSRDEGSSCRTQDERSPADSYRASSVSSYGSGINSPSSPQSRHTSPNSSFRRVSFSSQNSGEYGQRGRSLARQQEGPVYELDAGQYIPKPLKTPLRADVSAPGRDSVSHTGSPIVRPKAPSPHSYGQRTIRKDPTSLLAPHDNQPRQKESPSLRHTGTIVPPAAQQSADISTLPTEVLRRPNSTKFKFGSGSRAEELAVVSFSMGITAGADGTAVSATDYARA
jgi:hypothetical protein